MRKTNLSAYKNCKIQMRCIGEFIVLYQCHYPGFDHYTTVMQNVNIWGR